MKGFSEQEKNELIEMAKLSKKTGSSLSKVFLEFARKNKRAGGSVRNYYYFLIKNERSDEKELQSKTVEPFTKCETVEIIEKILTGTVNGKSVRRVIEELSLGNAKKALRIQNKYRNVISCDRPLVELVMKGLKQKGVSFKNPYDNKKEKIIMNNDIRAKEVRLITQDRENKGIVPTSEALSMADDAGLDLVLINPNQDPPVAKIMDFGKYKYEIEKKAKEAKKKQHTVDVKEVKIRYKIDTHDYQVRINNIKKFIAQGNKVKIVVMLRGREMQHSQLAFDLANRFVEDLKNEPIQIEKNPQLEGRNVTLFLGPQ